MMQPHHQSKILLATTPLDFRKGIDGFVAVCRDNLKQTPKNGRYFVFINRNRTRVRLLNYEPFYPLMKQIQARCQSDLDSEEVEANSNLGQAMKYFLKHFDAFTRFFQVQAVPLDNNASERILKIAIRNRKNAYFYKTPKGAEAGRDLTF